MDVNFYINFVLHVIYGRMGEADQMMRVAGGNICRIADELAKRFPLAEKPIYRGVIVEPAATLAAHPQYTFVSWSEDLDVARWFGCPRSVISQPLSMMRDIITGHVATLPAPRSRVLFHHSWARVFGGISLDQFALRHPLMGREGQRQIAWALQTQQEVITEPVAEIPLAPCEVDDDELADLEARLAPPWLSGLTIIQIAGAS